MNSEGPGGGGIPEAADRSTGRVCKGVKEVGLKIQGQRWDTAECFWVREERPARHNTELGSFSQLILVFFPPGGKTLAEEMISAFSYVSAMFVVAYKNGFLDL